MLNIAMVISELGYGGAQTMLIRLIRALNRQEFKIHVFIRESKTDSSIEEELKMLGINYTFLELNDNKISHGLKIVHKIKAFHSFTKALEAFKPDIVHCHLDYFYSPLYCFIKKKKLVITVHSQPHRVVSCKLKLLLRTLELNKLLKVVGCAKCISKDSKSLFRLKDDTVSTIYNPIQLREYSELRQNKSAVFSYIHIGRMEPVKNQIVLIDAFSKLIIDKPTSCLLIVGDGVLRNELEARCESLGIMSKVCFLGNQSTIPQLLCTAHVFVLSSDSEACPMTVLEAMACGIPVISTNVGGIGELIEDAGILVQKGDAQGLYKAMIKTQEMPEVLEIMSRKELELVKKYNVVDIATQYERLYLSFFEMRSRQKRVS